MKKYVAIPGSRIRPFMFIGHAITIVTDWGTNHFPNGAFLSTVLEPETNDTPIATHGVQPVEGENRPAGWEQVGFGVFRKLPVWSDGKVYQPGQLIEVNCLDGKPNEDGINVMKYEVKEPSVVTYNSKLDGTIDENDGWLQSVEGFENKYILENEQIISLLSE